MGSNPEVPHEGFIDTYRDEMWTLFDDHMNQGALYVNARQASVIHHVTEAGVKALLPVEMPFDGSLLLIIDYDDHLATFHLGRYGGPTLIKQYMKGGKGG